MLDIFNNTAFSFVRLTDAINQLKFAPGRIEQLGLFTPDPVDTTSVAIDLMDDGVFRIIAPTPRGGPGETLPPETSSMLAIKIPHFEINDGISADSVQGRRAWGTENELETVLGKVNRRQSQHGISLNVTQEYARIGAIKGIVTYAGTTPALNLFTTFGVAAQTEVAFNLAVSTNGVVRAFTADIVRTISAALGGLPFDHVHAFVGKTFMDGLIKNAEVRASFQNTPAAQWLRDGYVDTRGNKIFGAFVFGDIVFEEYRGNSELATYVADDKAYFFPVGVPGLFRTYYGPADYNETVNTLGRPRYTKMKPFANDKGYHLDSQMNNLEICTRPRALVSGRAGA